MTSRQAKIEEEEWGDTAGAWTDGQAAGTTGRVEQATGQPDNHLLPPGQHKHAAGNLSYDSVEKAEAGEADGDGTGGPKKTITALQAAW